MKPVLKNHCGANAMHIQKPSLVVAEQYLQKRIIISSALHDDFANFVRASCNPRWNAIERRPFYADCAGRTSENSSTLVL